MAPYSQFVGKVDILVTILWVFSILPLYLKQSFTRSPSFAILFFAFIELLSFFCQLSNTKIHKVSTSLIREGEPEKDFSLRKIFFLYPTVAFVIAFSERIVQGRFMLLFKYGRKCDMLTLSI